MWLPTCFARLSVANREMRQEGSRAFETPQRKLKPSRLARHERIGPSCSGLGKLQCTSPMRECRRKQPGLCRLGGEGNYFGLAAAGLRFGGGFGEKLLFGLLPVLEGISGGTVALQVDVIGAKGDLV